MTLSNPDPNKMKIFWPNPTHLFSFLTLFSSLIATTNSRSAETSLPASNLDSAEIFNEKKIQSIHLKFTPEDWKSMEPVNGPRPERGRSRSFLQGPAGGRNGIAAAFGITYNYVWADIEFGADSFRGVGVRYKGNGTFLTSRDSLKRSLKIDMNQFVKGQKLAGMTQFNLHNSVRDPSGMNESVAYELFRKAGIPAPRTSHAEVYVTVPELYNRKYLGLYNLVEDVGSRLTTKKFNVSGGALLKPVTPNLFADLGDDWKNYKQSYDPKSKLSKKEKDRIIETCKFVSTSDDQKFATGISSYFDLDNFATYLAMTVWLSDLDGILGPGQNYYLYLHPKTHKFSFIAWDQDQTFGQFPRGTQAQREGLSINRPWNGRNSFLGKLFASESFKTKYLNAIQTINQSVIEIPEIERQVKSLSGMLHEFVEKESKERLQAFNKAVSGKSYPLVMGPGYREPVETIPLITFVKARRKSVKDQLSGKSEGATFSGR